MPTASCVENFQERVWHCAAASALEIVLIFCADCGFVICRKKWRTEKKRKEKKRKDIEKIKLLIIVFSYTIILERLLEVTYKFFSIIGWRNFYLEE